MAAPYPRVPVARFPRVAARHTAEDRFWRKLQDPVVVKEYAAVTHIDFCQQSPHDYAVTSSTRVQIYGASQGIVKKSITRFNDLAYSGCFRPDGKLLVAGGEAGIIQVFDMSSRSILRRYEVHKQPVRLTRFRPDGLAVYSGSDDCTVRQFDLAAEQEVCNLDGHGDYVRCGAVSQHSPHLFLTGSYDRTVQLWDMRAGKSVFTMPHDDPVESVLFFPSGACIASAGGCSIKIWDVLGGPKPLFVLGNHQKTVTSLCFDGTGMRMLSGSLDHQVKVYDLQTYGVVHSIKYAAPILAVAVSPDNNLLAVGTVAGYLSVKRRGRSSKDKASRGSDSKGAQPGRPGSYRFFMRGHNVKPQDADFVVKMSRKPKLRPYDRMLKQFKHHEALDLVFQGGHQPVIVISLLQELIRRSALHLALRGRDDHALKPLLVFVVAHITNPRYTPLLLDVANIILDMFASSFGQSPLIDDLLTKLRLKVQTEIAFQEKLFGLVGYLDLLLAANPNN